MYFDNPRVLFQKNREETKNTKSSFFNWGFNKFSDNVEIDFDLIFSAGCVVSHVRVALTLGVELTNTLDASSKLLLLMYFRILVCVWKNIFFGRQELAKKYLRSVKTIRLINIALRGLTEIKCRELFPQGDFHKFS